MSSQITKILLRKGLESQRTTFVPSEAELAYVTDLPRVFMGDGVTPGGLPISVKNWGIVPNINTLITLQAEVGDLAFVNSETYSLTAAPASTPGNWGVVSGAPNGTVTTVEVGDFLNIDGNPNVKTFNQSGAITLEVNNLLDVIYPIGSVYITTVPYIDGVTSTSVFTWNNPNPGQFILTTQSYQVGIWNYLGTQSLASYSTYIYTRVS